MLVVLRKDDSAMDLANASSQTECRLLALPAELRIQIWELLLIQNTRSASHFPASYLFNNTSESSKRKKRFCANVLRTCKQINAEGTYILYGQNLFCAHSNLLSSLPSFLLYTSPERVKLGPVTYQRVANLIRRYFIYVRLDTDPRFTREQVRDSFTGVEELRIEVFQAMYGGCDFSVLKLFEDVRGVGKVQIQGSLGDGKYADWLANCMKQDVGTIVTPYYEQYIGGVPSWDAWAKGVR